jgi:hypothetical protein
MASAEQHTASVKKGWRRLGLPMQVGMMVAFIGVFLAVIGIARGNVPANPLSILLALLISGGSWGLVAWAVTRAAVDVERDLSDGDLEE